MGKNERSDNYKPTENVPKPKVLCAEIIGNLSSVKLVSDSFAKIVEPNENSDSHGQRSNDQNEKIIVHTLSAVIF